LLCSICTINNYHVTEDNENSAKYDTLAIRQVKIIHNFLLLVIKADTPEHFEHSSAVAPTILNFISKVQRRPFLSFIIRLDAFWKSSRSSPVVSLEGENLQMLTFY